MQDTTSFFPTRKYHAKVILFGEYTVLIGGDILAVPYSQFGARWQKGDSICPHLPRFLDFLTTKPTLFSPERIKNLRHQINEGWYLASDIPQGMGLGSSGSLVAAVYDVLREDDLPVANVREILMAMESYFHQRSSGIDPLVSYYDGPVAVLDGKLTRPEVETLPPFQLIDSNISRNTSKLVQHFNDLMSSDNAFATAIHRLKELNNQAIQIILEGENPQSIIEKISACQLETMTDFIPQTIQNQWNMYGSIWKICGAGGGGYFMRF